MRMLKRNKQKMWYSVPIGVVPKYQTDNDGNIIYDVIDGVRVPRDTGETEMLYSIPVEFSGNINSQLHNAIVRAFGSDDSNNYAKLIVEKGKYPQLANGVKIWRKSEIKFIDADCTIVDYASADYEIRGVLDEPLNEDGYYLQVMNHEVTYENNNTNTVI